MLNTGVIIFNFGLIRKGKFDVILEFYDLIIGIEVKFGDISSDDAVDNSEEDVQKLDDSIKNKV